MILPILFGLTIFAGCPAEQTTTPDNGAAANPDSSDGGGSDCKDTGGSDSK